MISFSNSKLSSFLLSGILFLLLIGDASISKFALSNAWFGGGMGIVGLFNGAFPGSGGKLFNIGGGGGGGGIPPFF